MSVRKFARIALLIPLVAAPGGFAVASPSEEDAPAASDRAQKTAQHKLAALVPGAQHIVDTNSGHEIQKQQPQLVVAAIRTVVDAVRKGRKRALP
jgi:hypothetical protein